MTERKIHGAIVHEGSGRKDCLIRVTLKAVILDDKGRVLVVKERGRDWWDIPGGGIEHGETVRDALARELFEEVSLRGEFEYQTLIAEDPRYLETHSLYQMRVTFIVVPENMTFVSGQDGDAVDFVDAREFENSPIWAERQILLYSSLAKERLGVGRS